MSKKYLLFANFTAILVIRSETLMRSVNGFDRQSRYVV